MNKNIKRPPGRPRKFNEEDVLMCAMNAFLEQGFEAVSYERIAQEMGLSKPSLYNTFGDKSSLFERVLDGYAIRAREHIISSFSDHDTLDKAVENLLRSAAMFYSRPDGPSLGCLLIGTALPAATHFETIRDTLSSFTHSIDKLLEDTIKTQYQGESSERQLSSRTLALQISSLIYALAIRSRMGLSRAELINCADELSQVITESN